MKKIFVGQEMVTDTKNVGLFQTMDNFVVVTKTVILIGDDENDTLGTRNLGYNPMREDWIVCTKIESE
jgi:hypothetical protein